MNSLEIALSGFFAIFSSFVGSFAGGGSTPLFLSFLTLTYSGSFLMALTLAKVSAFALTVVSGLIHRKVQTIDWALCAVMCIFGFLGTAIATYFAQFEFNETSFKWTVAGVLFLLGFYSLLGKGIPLNPVRVGGYSKREQVLTAFVFFTLNLLNGLTGGMGIAYLFFCTTTLKMSLIQAAAYSMLSGIFVVGLQSLYLIHVTRPPLLWMGLIVLGSIFGAYMGTRLQYLKGDRYVKVGYTSVLFVLAFLSLV